MEFFGTAGYVDGDECGAESSPSDLPEVNIDDLVSVSDGFRKLVRDSRDLEVQIQTLRKVLAEESESYTMLEGESESLSSQLKIVQIELREAEASDELLRFRSEDMLKANQDQVIVEDVSCTRSQILEVEERQLHLLQSQLKEKTRRLAALEKNVQEKEDKLENLREDRLPSSVPRLSESPPNSFLEHALQKARRGYHECANRLRKLKRENDALERIISLETETKLKPVLDRIVAAEISSKRIAVDISFANRDIVKLASIGDTLKQRMDILEKDRLEIEKAVEITRLDILEKQGEKEKLVLSKERIDEDRRANILALQEQRTELQKRFTERSTVMNSTSLEIMKLKQNIVQISFLKRAKADRLEEVGSGKTLLDKLEADQKKSRDKLWGIQTMHETKSNELEQIVSGLDTKTAELTSTEESIVRMRVFVEGLRRDLDLLKKVISKSRGIAKRLADAEMEYNTTSQVRKNCEIELDNLVEEKQKNPQSNICEIFILTNESLSERIHSTEIQIGKIQEHLIELSIESEALEVKKMELKSRYRENIELLQKIVAFKNLCMHLNRQIIARRAEIKVYETWKSDLMNSLNN
jgi:hypothetical protein